MKIFLLFLIKYYRKISPLWPPLCRYTPTCSLYTYQAIEKYGTWKGIKLSIKRILRCHPWSEGGEDPLLPEEPVII